MEEYLEEYRDLFDLYKRIREIDKNYVLLKNKMNGKIEVHNFNQRGVSFVMEAKPLDARLIEKLQKTRVENSVKFFRELDLQNEKIEREKFNSLTQKTREINEEIAKYSFSKNQDLTSSEIAKILNI